MEEIYTACTYDCPDACGLRIELDGEQVEIKGDPDHPITRGFVCSRIRRHVDRLRSPERITRPMVRSGAGLKTIGWDEALDLAAQKLSTALQRLGAPSVVYIGGGGSLGLSKELVAHFFRSLGPVTTIRGGACGEAGEAAQVLDFGEAVCHDYTDLENSQAVVLWGKNPVATGTHLVPFVKAAREWGAPVVLIDPVPLESARLADRIIRVRPGGDGYLALAVVQRLLERDALDPAAIERAENTDQFFAMLSAPELSLAACAERAGVEAEEVDYLAGLYAERRPVATWIGWGMQRCGSGGANVRCIDALSLLSGNVGLFGGGANYTSRRRRGLDLSIFATSTGRTVAAHHLGQELAALDDPPVRFAYITAANPVTQYADSGAIGRALERLDFVVVADAFLTDTARTADLFLPVCLMLEEGEDAVGSFQHHYVTRARKVLEPPGEARPDLWIVRELSRRLGRPEDPLLADPAAALRRMTAAWFRDEGQARFCRNPSQPALPFAERFATESGKARLLTEPPPPAPAPDPDYPLTFMTISSRRWQTSQLLESEQHGPAECVVHPEAPGARGLAEGELARVTSPLGSLEVTLRLDERLHEAVCLVHRGGWVLCGRGVNSLVQATSTDLGEGTAFFDQRVRLERRSH